MPMVLGSRDIFTPAPNGPGDLEQPTVKTAKINNKII